MATYIPADQLNLPQSIYDWAARQNNPATRTPTSPDAYTGGTAAPRPSTQPPSTITPPPTPGGTTTTGTPSVAETWTPNAQPPPPPEWLAGVVNQNVQHTQQNVPQRTDRSNALYDQLWGRATQSLDISSNDPVIRQQADAYAAAQERARRDHLADVAERSGPYANLRGEQRLGYERMGQSVGAFEAELVGRELESRRNEIAQALQLYASTLSTDQQRELQRQLALMDHAIAQQRIGIDSGGREQDWMIALLENEQFLADLGLRTEDRAAYYDLIRSGQL